MSEATELYSPPESDVGAGPRHEDARHYVVGVRKFLVLSIATLGLYRIYWFWRNWRNVRDASGASLWPVPRGLFNVFFTHSLFRDVEDHLRNQRLTYPWTPGGAATLVVAIAVITSIASNALSGAGPLVDLFVFLAGFLGPIAMVPAQRAINRANGDPDGESNARLTLANWLWMIPGLVYWALVLIGTVALVMEGA